jgi:hypothetical protein
VFDLQYMKVFIIYLYEVVIFIRQLVSWTISQVKLISIFSIYKEK